MLIDNKYHLTYCTNIHPAENWQEVFQSLQSYTIPVREKVVPNLPFGIGLRLSGLASNQLLEKDNLGKFKLWLAENNMYIFTINGFPHGGFHRQKVKDNVHKPDWTTSARLDYTIRLAEILAQLLPADLKDGGISTSPLSYKHWLKSREEKDNLCNQACLNFAIVIERLHQIKQEKGVTIHIDLEPEPDGVIENCAEAITFFKEVLIPQAGDYLKRKLAVSFHIAEEIIKEHIRLCYDVCHSAVMYEEPSEVLEALKKEGIKIGKVQISAAIKINISNQQSERKLVHERLKAFAGSTYLHQVIGRRADNTFERFPDLSPALKNIFTTNAEEWRMHFHVPVFTGNYNGIYSTSEEIKKVFEHLKKNQFTNHLEIETYTWDILPEPMKSEITDSIEKEYKWVLENLS